ncbi:MAG: response regulator [Desulfobacteraceae bacterium]
MKILVVDDQSTMRALIKGMLARMGFDEVEEAEDGDVALNRLKQEKYDLVISDVHMPRMNGLDFLKQVRGTAGIKETPFLMVTTESSKDAVLQAIKLKVNGYVVKPFTLETLRDKLRLLGFDSGSEEQDKEAAGES